MACKGCAERREKFIELFNQTKAWLANPHFNSSLFERPMPPVRTFPVGVEKVKKDQHKKDMSP